jgi:hypothetical protein
MAVEESDRLHGAVVRAGHQLRKSGVLVWWPLGGAVLPVFIIDKRLARDNASTPVEYQSNLPAEIPSNQIATPMKPFVIALVALASLHTADGAAPQTQDERNKQRLQEKEVREKRRAAVQAVLENKDKNRDGSLTKEEYIDGEADPAAAAKKFDKYNKNRDRVLSKGEIADSLSL